MTHTAIRWMTVGIANADVGGRAEDTQVGTLSREVVVHPARSARPHSQRALLLQRWEGYFALQENDANAKRT